MVFTVNIFEDWDAASRGIRRAHELSPGHWFDLDIRLFSHQCSPTRLGWTIDESSNCEILSKHPCRLDEAQKMPSIGPVVMEETMWGLHTQVKLKKKEYPGPTPSGMFSSLGQILAPLLRLWPSPSHQCKSCRKNWVYKYVLKCACISI